VATAERAVESFRTENGELKVFPSFLIVCNNDVLIWGFSRRELPIWRQRC
jgi:hypothetical protein